MNPSMPKSPIHWHKYEVLFSSYETSTQPTPEVPNPDSKFDITIRVSAGSFKDAEVIARHNLRNLVKAAHREFEITRVQNMSFPR